MVFNAKNGNKLVLCQEKNENAVGHKVSSGHELHDLAMSPEMCSAACH